MNTKIGIIGAGTVGRALAQRFITAGYTIEIANSKGPESLQELVGQLGTASRAVNAATAAENEVVILAVRWENTDEVLEPLQEKLTGKILVDATNPYSQNKWLFKLPKGVVASEIIAAKAPGAKVVKAFNNLIGAWLSEDPAGGGRRVTFISGDDEAAKTVIAAIAEKAGFAPVDLGTLKEGELSQGGRALAGKNLVLLDKE